MSMNLGFELDGRNVHLGLGLWEDLLNLACAHGWEPAGTEPPSYWDEELHPVLNPPMPRRDEHGEFLRNGDGSLVKPELEDEDRTSAALAYLELVVARADWDGNYWANDYQRVSAADAAALGEALLTVTLNEVEALHPRTARADHEWLRRFATACRDSGGFDIG